MSFPTFNTVLDFLNAHIVGQEAAKRRLVSALYNHYYDVAKNGKANPKANVLITGPTGSGKTLLLETLAEIINVAFKQVNAAELVPAAYEGFHISQLFSNLLQECQGNLERAEHGIVVLDEIDKRKFRNSSREDIGQMIQQELLKPLVSDKVVVDTTNILFIGTGAFVGLTDLVRKRLNKGDLGENEALAQLMPEDFAAFGMVPEFMGRFPIRLHVDKLTRDEFLSIIRSQKNSYLGKKKQFFEEHGFELHLTEEAIEAMADRAYSHNLGVRALQTIIAEACDEIQLEFDDLYDKGRRRIEISREVILGTAKPRAVFSTKFTNAASKVVRGKLNELFARLKPTNSEPTSKSNAMLPAVQLPQQTGITPAFSPVQAPAKSESQPFLPTVHTPPKPEIKAQAFQGPASAVSPIPNPPFNVVPGGTPNVVLTEADWRELKKIVHASKNPPNANESIFTRLRARFANPLNWSADFSFRLPRLFKPVFLAVCAYALVAIAVGGLHERSISGLFRSLLCRDEFGIGQGLGILLAVPVLAVCRFSTAIQVLKSALLGYLALQIYCGIITFGARDEIFSYRHALLSWITFLDHAFWRPGHITAWNVIAAAVALGVAFLPVSPSVEGSPESVVAWVGRYLTGRGPQESNQINNHPLQ